MSDGLDGEAIVGGAGKEAQRDGGEDRSAPGGEYQDREQERYPAKDEEAVEELSSSSEGRVWTWLETVLPARVGRIARHQGAVPVHFAASRIYAQKPLEPGILAKKCVTWHKPAELDPVNAIDKVNRRIQQCLVIREVLLE